CGGAVMIVAAVAQNLSRLTRHTTLAQSNRVSPDLFVSLFLLNQVIFYQGCLLKIIYLKSFFSTFQVNSILIAMVSLCNVSLDLEVLLNWLPENSLKYNKARSLQKFLKVSFLFLFEYSSIVR